ncbi:MAG: hypothetical protein ACPGJV_00180 [Bacteriovoracaceae bacterium]
MKTTIFLVMFLSLTHKAYGVSASKCPEKMTLTDVKLTSIGGSEWQISDAPEDITDNTNFQDDVEGIEELLDVPFEFEILDPNSTKKAASKLNLELQLTNTSGKGRSTKCHYDLKGSGPVSIYNQDGEKVKELESKREVTGRATLKDGSKKATLSIMTNLMPKTISSGIFKGDGLGGADHYLSYFFRKQIDVESKQTEVKLDGFSYMFHLASGRINTTTMTSKLFIEYKSEKEQ